MSTSTLAPQGSVNLSDFRYWGTNARNTFTRLRTNHKNVREKGPPADFITLISLISEVYRDYGDELAPVQQHHPKRETQYNQGHTSNVSHTVLRRHGASVVSDEGDHELPTESIIIKRPRGSVVEAQSAALISFITELRIETHQPLREHPNIVRFQSVGWDFEDEAAKIPRPLLIEELAPQGSCKLFA
jgi:hypothetical protein